MKSIATSRKQGRFSALVSDNVLRFKQIFLTSVSPLPFYHSHMMPMTPSLHQDKAKTETSVGPSESTDYNFGGHDIVFF